MSIARLLLLLKSGLADISTPQLDVEDALHGTQHLLIGRGGASLKIGHNGRRGVALCGELLLRESLGLEVGAGFLNGEADVLADRLGLDDVVGSVDHSQALAFYGGLSGLWGMLVSARGIFKGTWMETYSIASGILLLSTDDLTAALSSVERRLSPDDGLAIGTAAATDALANLDGVGVPVGHFEGSVVLDEVPR